MTFPWPPGSRRGASCMYCKQAVCEKARIAYSHLLGDSLLCDHSRSSTCTCATSMCFYPCDVNDKQNNRKETVRFDSFRFRTFRKLIGSVRCGSACAFRTRRGSVRFGSVPRPVPAGSGIKRFGSVQPVRFGFSFLPEIPCAVQVHSRAYPRRAHHRSERQHATLYRAVPAA